MQFVFALTCGRSGHTGIVLQSDGGLSAAARCACSAPFVLTHSSACTLSPWLAGVLQLSLLHLKSHESPASRCCPLCRLRQAALILLADLLARYSKSVNIALCTRCHVKILGLLAHVLQG